MATQVANLPAATVTNLRTAVTPNLEAGQNYIVQNAGPGVVVLHESAAAPTGSPPIGINMPQDQSLQANAIGIRLESAEDWWGYSEYGGQLIINRSI